MKGTDNILLLNFMSAGAFNQAYIPSIPPSTRALMKSDHRLFTGNNTVYNVS